MIGIASLPARPDLLPAVIVIRTAARGREARIAPREDEEAAQDSRYGAMVDRVLVGTSMTA